MLQPTSCGPGPPDKILEFKCNELQDSINVVNNKNNNNNGNGNNGQGHKPGVAIKMVKATKAHNGVSDNEGWCSKHDVPTTSSTRMNTFSHENKTNNNNNCHLKNIKFYLNNILTYPNFKACNNKPKTISASWATTSEAATTAVSTRPLDGSNISLSSFSAFTNIIMLLHHFCYFLTAAAATFVAKFNKTWWSGGVGRHNQQTSISRKCFLMFLMLFGILAHNAHHQVAAEKSKHYYMQSLCKNHFLQQLYRKIDGAVLWSQNERNLDCIITFQTHSILQRFMLRFDMLQLDCNDHLYVYDGAHAVATPKIDISCRQTKQTVSSILTRTNFVTLKYVTDNWGTDTNGFKLVITSVKDPKHTCKDFTCESNGFCINPDLLCDGINHCSDNSDESVHNLCQNETTSTVFGMDMTWIVMIVVSILLIISAIVITITICVCRRQEDSNNQHTTAMQLHHMAETNGSSKHLHYTHGVGGVGGGGGAGGTLSREHTQLPPTSGNWHHPAGPYGYLRTQLNYLKMATKVRPIWCLANFVN
ncbi:low-density lipoprotein receptor domain containing lost and found isoform X2 [Musca autumnalis]|uniref:low-density lipoprotein receptor domain containing lost and found isoform X2 n=1 Tax=Musca autumnalis TaxID=221902 RepID=UPI003CF2EBEC